MRAGSRSSNQPHTWCLQGSALLFSPCWTLHWLVVFGFHVQRSTELALSCDGASAKPQDQPLTLEGSDAG